MECSDSAKNLFDLIAEFYFLVLCDTESKTLSHRSRRAKRNDDRRQNIPFFPYTFTCVFRVQIRPLLTSLTVMYHRNSVLGRALVQHHWQRWLIMYIMRYGKVPLWAIKRYSITIVVRVGSHKWEVHSEQIRWAQASRRPRWRRRLMTMAEKEYPHEEETNAVKK